MKDIFLHIGVSGFMAVFQAAGGGLCLAAWDYFATEYRKRRPRLSDLPSFVFGIPFIFFFALAPILMAYKFNGWAGAVFQSLVLAMILYLIIRSYRQGVKTEPLDHRAIQEKELSRPVVPDKRKHFLRALPGSLFCFYLSAAYAAAWLGKPLPTMTHDWLVDLMTIELIAIHSLPFISLITLIRFGEHRHWRFFQWFLFITWYSLYIGFAIDVRDSWDAIPTFVAATLSTYLGFMLQESDVNRVVLVFKRWGVCLALFAMTAAAAEARTWHSHHPMVEAGAFYFAAIGAIELTPLYRTHWRRWITRNAEILKRKLKR